MHVEGSEILNLRVSESTWVPGLLSHMQALLVLETKQRYLFELQRLMADIYREDVSKRKLGVGADKLALTPRSIWIQQGEFDISSNQPPGKRINYFNSNSNHGNDSQTSKHTNDEKVEGEFPKGELTCESCDSFPNRRASDFGLNRPIFLVVLAFLMTTRLSSQLQLATSTGILTNNLKVPRSTALMACSCKSTPCKRSTLRKSERNVVGWDPTTDVRSWSLHLVKSKYSPSSHMAQGRLTSNFGAMCPVSLLSLQGLEGAWRTSLQQLASHSLDMRLPLCMFCLSDERLCNARTTMGELTSG
jgi:hypothetical protein